MAHAYVTTAGLCEIFIFFRSRRRPSPKHLGIITSYSQKLGPNKLRHHVFRSASRRITNFVANYVVSPVRPHQTTSSSVSPTPRSEASNAHLRTTSCTFRERPLL